MKKTSFWQYFKPKQDEIGQEREKNSKNFKNLFPALFLAKTGLDRPRKGEKNFSPEFRSYSTPARKFQKK